MSWITKLLNLSKSKKIMLAILAALMIFNDIGRIISMLTDLALLSAFIFILAKGLAEVEQKNNP